MGHNFFATCEKDRPQCTDTCFAFDETRFFLEDCNGMRRTGEPDFFYAVRVRQCICGAIAGEANSVAAEYFIQEFKNPAGTITQAGQADAWATALRLNDV